MDSYNEDKYRTGGIPVAACRPVWTSHVGVTRVKPRSRVGSQWTTPGMVVKVNCYLLRVHHQENKVRPEIFLSAVAMNTRSPSWAYVFNLFNLRGNFKMYPKPTTCSTGGQLHPSLRFLALGQEECLCFASRYSLLWCSFLPPYGGSLGAHPSPFFCGPSIGGLRNSSFSFMSCLLGEHTATMDVWNASYLYFKLLSFHDVGRRASPDERTGGDVPPESSWEMCYRVK